jgi:steroid delta-isomerase-like uncharacterized protein
MMKKLVLFFCLLVVVSMALGAQMMDGPGMCEKKARVILDKVLEMWNKPDFALIPELYTADCVATTSSSPETYIGHEGIRKWIEINRAMMPDMVMTFDEIMATPGRIFTIWTMTGTQTGPMVMPGGTLPPSGRKVRVTGMSLDTLKDGKMAKESVVFNLLDMLMSLGFTLTPPAPPAM